MKLGMVIGLAFIALGCGAGSPASLDDIARNKVCLIVGWTGRVPGDLRDAIEAARRHDGAAMAGAAGEARVLGRVSVATLDSFASGSIPTNLPQADVRTVARFAEQGATFFGGVPPDTVALDSFETTLPVLDSSVRTINAAAADCF